MRFVLALLLMLPGLAFAAGSGGGSDTSPPKPTQTTKSCKGVQVWDAATGKCVNPRGSSLDSDTLMGAVRELAYAGRIEDAQGVLREMPDQNADLVLTYWGFTNRKLGQTELANAFYRRAITRNPDNILARSYMGQGFVTEGRLEDAKEQLHEIQARGGKGSWPETALYKAIRTGTTHDY